VIRAYATPTPETCSEVTSMREDTAAYGTSKGINIASGPAKSSSPSSLLVIIILSGAGCTTAAGRFPDLAFAMPAPIAGFVLANAGRSAFRLASATDRRAVEGSDKGRYSSGAATHRQRRCREWVSSVARVGQADSDV
jgi:hypothetical protein